MPGLGGSIISRSAFCSILFISCSTSPAIYFVLSTLFNSAFSAALSAESLSISIPYIFAASAAIDWEIVPAPQ
jgi:hypothetical protein